MQNEPIGVGEQVLTILRQEGEEVRPEDIRCEAKKGQGRCKKDKMFDTETDTWLRWCDEHQKHEQKARAEGGPRVERFEIPEAEEDA